MLLWLVSLMSPVFCWVTLMPSTEPAVWLVFKLRGASGEVATNQSAGQRWVRHRNKQINQWTGFDLWRKSVLRHRWIYMSSRVCGCLWGAHVTTRRPSRHVNHQISTSSHFWLLSLLCAVLYEIYRPDNKPLTLMLPVNTSVQDVMSATVEPGGDHILVKMNSTGGGTQISIDTTCA